MSLYTNLKEVVQPSNTALVVWDVQNMLVKNAFNRAEFLANIQQFISAARSVKIPVVFSKIALYPKQFESNWRNFLARENARTEAEKRALSRKGPNAEEMEIHQSVKPEADDLVIEKYTTSIFIGTPFEQMMRNRGITTLLFTGISTDIGIDSSARDAVNREFYTIVIEDCVSSLDRELHEAALKTLQKICLIKPSEGIMKRWQ